jgi:3-oxoacyl-[acyl-carrier protein] reductase
MNVSSVPRRRVALVTGGSQGLGEVIVRTLHAEGYALAIGDIAIDKAAALAQALDASGASARALTLDVRTKSHFAAALDDLSDWGGVDVLVNNAAMTLTTPVMDIDADEFDAVMAVNLRGPFFGCQVIGAYMQARGAGRIINISSQAGQMGGTVAGAHYAASKAGVILLTKYFAREFGASGVTVNAVSPGALEFPAVRAAFAPERVKALEAMIPVRHLGNPGDVAAVVALLARADMAYATGATWDVNGGMLMR